MRDLRRAGEVRRCSCRSWSAGEATGVISLQNIDREHAFSDADVRLLTTLAGSLSVALENARLFEETRQRNAELALINEVQRGLAENLDMQAMYDLVGDRLHEIFDAQVVDIGILDPAAGRIRFPYAIERGVRFPDEPIEVVRVPQDRPRDAGAGRHQRGHGATERRGRVIALISGEAASVRRVRPAPRRRPGHRTDLAPELDREHAFTDADVRLLTRWPAA